ncbi:MAG: pyruvate kinase [Lachnospiraceae bacterium]|nr:pyruvate kinase [Lachnospiraceae bacterium]
MKRTKIVCTMGPNTDNSKLLESLVDAGMDVARFNFSHGSYEEHKGRMDELKRIRQEKKIPVALLLDTKGPEIRTGVLEGGQKIHLNEGDEITLTTAECTGNKDRISISYQDLPKDVAVGGTILIDDGLIGLEILHITDTDITCKIVNGGDLGERKGVNVPNVKINLPALTEKDIADIRFGIEQEIDYIAVSFVRKGDDVRKVRAVLEQYGGQNVNIISKIENAEGVDNIDEIIELSDGIMVARGDLGVEIPAYEVPYVQKEIIAKCNQKSKPVITATQMLDSMIRNPRPTRAEVGDVANAVYDGTDAVMLSGETAMGKYPLEAVNMMAQIVMEAEKHLDHEAFRSDEKRKHRVSTAVGIAAVNLADNMNAACICTPTMSGKTTVTISNLRPSIPILAVTPDEAVKRKLQLYWGVYSVTGYMEDSTENIISHALYMITREKLVQSGDMVVFTAGDPKTNEVKDQGNATNMLQVVQVK